MSYALRALHIDEEERFLVRVAWACYVEGMTQGAAAERFGVTRLRVNKALGEVRRRGLVRISIKSPYASCAELESQLKLRYQLTEVHVTPRANRPENVQLLVGTALGHFLRDYLANPSVRLFGMSWGQTLNLATRFMEPLNRKDLEIVAVMGSLSKGSEINSFEITTRLAELCNAQHSYLTAPLYAGSRESRDTICQLDVFRDTITKITSVDAMAMAAGDISPRTLLVRHGLPKGVSIEELIDLGAVGDVLGYVLNARGEPIDHSINEKVIGMKLSDLKNIKPVILAAGGAHKIPIIKAVLIASLIDILITDEDTALGLMQTE